MDLFYDIFWTLIGAVLGALLFVHIFRRIAAPYRLKIFLSSGKTVTINVRNVQTATTRMSWTLSKWVPCRIAISDFDMIEAVKVTDRRYNF